jgi:hypothetical protein
MHKIQAQFVAAPDVTGHLGEVPKSRNKIGKVIRAATTASRFPRPSAYKRDFAMKFSIFRRRSRANSDPQHLENRACLSIPVGLACHQTATRLGH